MRSASERTGLLAGAVLLTVVVAFLIYCVQLMLAVSRERAEQAVRDDWLARATELQARPDAYGLATLRVAVSGHPGAERLALHLADPRKGLDEFVRDVRRDLSDLSTSLSARWDAMGLVALSALGFAALSLALLLLLRRRRLAAAAAQARLAAANDELRRAHEAAKAAADGKSRLVAYVSHEFRTPMQAIMAMIGLLEDAALTAELRQRYVATLRASTEDLLRLVDGLLDVARIESGKTTQRVDEFSPRTLLEDAARLLDPGARKKGLELRSDLAPDLPRKLRGDRMRLRQVVINLLGNAIKYTARGHVELRARAELLGATARLRVDVADTGPGISRAMLARLFQPFARAQESGIVRLEGSGLGLSISKQLIESLGGRLDVESIPGVGSTFWFEVELPVLEAGPPRSEPPKSIVRGIHLLLADDDTASRTMLATALERAGNTVDAVGDGESAVASALSKQYAAIILDVQLPNLDGPGAARKIRAARSDVPLVALTGHTEPDIVARCHESGFDTVLIKPVSLEALRTSLAKVLSDRTGPVDLSVLRGYLSADDPGFVPGLIDTFLREAERDVTALKATADRRHVAQLAHRLKGSSAGFGARNLAALCQNLYAAATREAPTTAEIAAVVDEFTRVQAILLAEKTRLQKRA